MRLIAVLVALAFCQLTAAVLFGESGGPVASAHNALTRGKQMLAAWIHPSKGVALRKGAPRNQSPISLLGCMTCDTGVVDPKSNKHIRESSKKLDAEANSWANRASASDEHSLYLYGSRTGSRKSSTSSSPHSRRRDGSGKGVGRTDHLLLAQSRPGSPIPSRHDPHINNIFLGNSYWGRQSLATPPKSVWGSPGSPTGPLRNEVGKQVFRSKSFKPATSFSFQPEVSSLSHDAHEPGSTSPDLTHFKRSGRKKTDLTPLNVPKRSEEIQRRRVQIEAIMPISTEMTLMKRSSHGQVAFMMQNNLQRRLLKSGYAKAKKVLRAVGNMGCTGCGKAWSPQPSVADHYWRLGSASFSDATRSRHSRSVSFSDMSTSLKESSLTPKDLPHLRNGGQISPSRLMQESPPRQPPNENFDDPEQWNRVWKWIPRPPAAKPAEPVPKTVVESIPLPLLPPRAPPKKFKRTSSAAGSASTVHPTTKTPPSSISDLIKRGLTENLFKLCKGCTRPSAAEESSLAPLSAAHSDSPAFRRLTSEHMSRMQHWTEHGRQPLRERPLQTETEDLRLSEVPGPMSMRAKKTAIAAWARRQGKLPRLAGGGTQERPWAEENLGHDRPVFDPWLLSPERRPPELEPGHTSQQHSFDTPRALSPTRLSDAGEGSRGGEASRHKTNDPSAASVRSSTLSGQNSLTALEAAFRKAEGRANKSPEKGTRATSARRLAERTRDHRLAKRDLRSDQVLQKRFLGKLFSCFGGCKSSSPKFPKIPAGATDAEVKKFAGSLLGKTSTISGTRHRTHRRAHSLQILQKRLSRSLFACFGLCKAPLPPRMPQIRTTEAELLKVAADRKPHGAISSSHLAHAERRDIVHILHRRFLKALFSCFMCKSGDSPRFPSIPKGATDADVKRIAGSMLGKTSTISGTRHRTHRRGIQVNELEVTADRAEKRGENGQVGI
ncbi:hypothetical protein IE81DRAFT_323042 [Ceraceosorus guamensis]|uniref:Uncharacterized protein n=1 Tax=Ceraceosorus guamensis TaxID=1522189 RepID=A0A316VZK4_9BASI|nr:hypothetical protein IE81DRAFT_323042 [Ceraceosorus guamensis]PWN42902.1 hypothetical protein IE81DRAFT_323042 [Ceraceosorus guamensis]